jgi:hypothetical protein
MISVFQWLWLLLPCCPALLMRYQPRHHYNSSENVQSSPASSVVLLALMSFLLLLLLLLLLLRHTLAQILLLRIVARHYPPPLAPLLRKVSSRHSVCPYVDSMQHKGALLRSAIHAMPAAQQAGMHMPGLHRAAGRPH